MFINKLTPQEWSEISQNAYRVAFGATTSPSFDRVDFALVGVNEEGILVGYSTCHELNSDSVYMQFGGSFPGTKNTIKTFKYYVQLIEHLKSSYSRISTYIENTNKVMIKMAMKAGFLITGLRYCDGGVLLELSMKES